MKTLALLSDPCIWDMLCLLLAGVRYRDWFEVAYSLAHAPLCLTFGCDCSLDALPLHFFPWKQATCHAYSRVGLAAIVYYVMHTWLKRMDSQVWRQPKRAGKQSKTWSQAHSLPCSLVEGSEPMKQAKRRRQKLEMTINQITWSTLDTHVSGQ